MKIKVILIDHELKVKRNIYYSFCLFIFFILPFALLKVNKQNFILRKFEVLNLSNEFMDMEFADIWGFKGVKNSIFDAKATTEFLTKKVQECVSPTK